ncbi:MAG TPA: hypothetical protein VMR97_11955 [Acidimicrobiales bacterium]|nr:hypothetical protein [Acidimicrobiales bacterium]
MARRKARGRPVLGAISGLLFGFFLSLTLSVFAGVPLNSILYFILTAVGLVAGLALGLSGPFVRKKHRAALSVPEPATSGAAAQPSPLPAAWAPTHVVPEQGMRAWTAADPSAPPAPELDPLLPVQVVERVGDWGRVVCANGWSTWVDARALRPVP